MLNNAAHLLYRTRHKSLSERDMYAGQPEPLLAAVKRRKAACFGHVTRHEAPTKAMPRRIVKGKQRGGQRK